MIRSGRGARYISCEPRSHRDRQSAGRRTGQDPPVPAVHAGPGRRAGARGPAGHAGRRGARDARRPARARPRRRRPAPGCPTASRSIAQRGDGLAERLAAAFEDVGEARLPGRHGHAAGHARRCSTPGLDAVAGRRLRVRRGARRRLLGHRPAHARPGGVRRRADEHRAHRRRPARADGAARPAPARSCRRCSTSTPSRTRWPSPPRRPARASRPSWSRRSAMLGGRSRHDRARRPRSRRVAAPRAPPRRPPLRATARLLPADALYGRLLASAAQHVLGRPSARHRGSPTGGSSRCRSTAGSRPPTPSTSRSSPASRRPCSTSAAGPAAISPRCAPRASAGSAWTSPPSPSGSRAGAAREAINGSLWSQVPRAGTWRTILLLDGNIGIGGAPILLLRRAGELLAPGGAIVVEVDPPGAPTHRVRVRLEAPGVVSEWFRWARVGVDGVADVARRGGVRGRRRSARSRAAPS